MHVQKIGFGEKKPKRYQRQVEKPKVESRIASASLWNLKSGVLPTAGKNYDLVQTRESPATGDFFRNAAQNSRLT